MSTLLAVFTAGLPAVSFLTPCRLAVGARWRYESAAGGAGPPVSRRRLVGRPRPRRTETCVAYQRGVYPFVDAGARASARQTAVTRSRRTCSAPYRFAPSGLTHSLGTRSSNGSGVDAVPASVRRLARWDCDQRH